MEQPLKNFVVDCENAVVVVVGQHKHEEGQFHKEWIFAEYIAVVEERQDLVVIVVVDVVKAIKLIF